DGRTWSGPAPLSAPGAGATLVDAAAAGGRAVAVWTRAPGVVQAARHRPGEGWTLDGDIGAPDGGAVTPQVAMGPGGEAVAAWIGPRSEVAWAARPPGGRWAAGGDLTPPGHGASGLRMEAAGAAAVLAWTAADATVRAARGDMCQLAERGVADWHAAWTGPVALSAAGEPCYAPRLAAGPGGALVAWHRADARVQACLLGADGSPGAPVDLSGDAGPGLYPSPAMGDGAAVVAWRGDGDVARAARLGPGGWSAAEPLTRPGEAPEPPLAAVDARGAVTVAY
ncbi:MAG TPA: hypothetical protein VK904_05585, partial [Miltoncostaeaceae bacterium]|nr:hypothetical protein [Miltoncostaeaceae bacterium]